MKSTDHIRTAIRESKYSIARISDEAGVPRQTIYSFVSGQTKRLRSDTQSAIERALSKLGEYVVREDSTPFEHELRSEALSLGLDPDAIAVKAVESAIRRKRIDAWIEDNREAMEANAKGIRENGLWSDGLRQF